jgi:hypothetical protein
VSDYSAYFANDETSQLFGFHEFIILWSQERSNLLSHFSLHPYTMDFKILLLVFFTPLATAVIFLKTVVIVFFVQSGGSSVCGAKDLVVSGTSMRVTSGSRCRVLERYKSKKGIFILT